MSGRSEDGAGVVQPRQKRKIIIPSVPRRRSLGGHRASELHSGTVTGSWEKLPFCRGFPQAAEIDRRATYIPSLAEATHTGIPRLDHDDEANRLSARATRYARLGVNAGALAARVGVNRLRGGGREMDAKALASAFGSMKGPLMKVAQMLTTIPDAVPAISPPN